MKKTLSKLVSKNERTDTSNSGTQREASCFIGKQFTVGRTVVTVEDILAEGQFSKHWIYSVDGILSNVYSMFNSISFALDKTYKK